MCSRFLAVACLLRCTSWLAVLLLLSRGRADAQEPLFTFVQISDSQPGTEAEWQGFEDVLATIAEAGGAGALLPRPVDLVLFPGDIVKNNTIAEWVRARGMLDTWLTANDIPFLAAPGNHDQGTTTQNYEQFIASAAVWEAGSASFTGHNGPMRTTGWAGLRFIGFNNSSGSSSTWNTVSSADLALIQSRVSAAAAAGENVFLVCHHPHDGSGRMPLASVLPEPAIVGYVHGHSGSPAARLGLTGVDNPNVWKLNSNAIVEDRDLLYYEAFQDELRVHVVILDDNPSQLPAPQVVSLVFPLSMPVAADRGFEDASHAGARAWPSGPAPEKKLWFQGGSWWGVLWHEQSLSYRIQRLDTAAQDWIDWGTSVSGGPNRSFDALASGAKLYLSSHVYSVPSAPGAGSPGQVLRYSFDATRRTYALDAGFPVAINDARTETLVLAKDTTGTLWATWTHGGVVRVNHTMNGNDLLWSGAMTLPVTGAGGLDPAEAPALIAFDGKLGLAWSDRADGRIRFAVRDDAAPATSWSPETAMNEPGAVSDALDLGSSGGRVYLATETPSGALRLLARSVAAPGLGTWTVREIADAAADLAQPILLVDQASALLRVFATGPTLAGGSALGAGAVYEKVAPLATLLFPSGRGTPVIQDGNSPAVGAPSSTRQVLDSSTGLVVLASNELTQRAWHAHAALGSAPLPPMADFSASPRAGDAPLLVRFTDLSSGAPTGWWWDFGDGSTSNAASPEHVYAAAGSYGVTLSVSNGAGADTLSRPAYVSVTQPTSVVTRTPVADAMISENSRGTNYGSLPTLRVRTTGGSSQRDFLKFDLTGLGPVSSARLRLFVVDPSNSGGSVFSVGTGWTESGVTWNNQPALQGSAVASIGSAAVDTWKEVDVTSAVSGPGLVALALSGGSSDAVFYSSREGANPPQLVLTVQELLVADFTAAPRSGSVGSPSPAQTFRPIADAWVSEASPGGNYGLDAALGTRTQAGSSLRSFLRFDLASMTGTPQSARLRLFVTEESNSGGSLFLVPSSWTETGISWSSQPSLPATSLATAGAAAGGEWVELDVSSAVLGPGIVSFAVAGGTANGVLYSSREGATPPELVVQTGDL